jgi:hypothetical protein
MVHDSPSANYEITYTSRRRWRRVANGVSLRAQAFCDRSGQRRKLGLLISDPADEDTSLIERTLNHFGVANLGQLHSLAVGSLGRDKMTGNRSYANLAPIVTDAALDGSPIARGVCGAAAARLPRPFF